MTKNIIKLVWIICFCVFIPAGFAIEESDITNDYEEIFSEEQSNINSSENSDFTQNKKIDYYIDEVNDTIEAEFSLFDGLDNQQPIEKPEGSTLFGRVSSQEFERTDVPRFLMKHEAILFPEKGIFNKVRFYGAYQGSMNFKWQNSHYQNSTYNFGFSQIGILGQFTDKYTDFKLLLNPRPAEGLTYMQNFVSDAYIINSRIPHHKVSIGMTRNAIGYEGGTSSYILPFVTRSQIARTFGSTRALGVKVMGNYSLGDYSFAFNSSDRFFHEFFPGAEFTGWVNLKPLGKTNGKYGKLTIGGGINAGRNHTNYTVGGFYAGYRYKRFWSTFEYAIADGYNGRSISTKKAEGFYGTLGYKITPKVQLVARYDQFKPDRNISGNLRREISGGINWFLKGQALKLMLNFVYCMNQNTSDSMRVILATQILL